MTTEKRGRERERNGLVTMALMEQNKLSNKITHAIKAHTDKQPNDIVHWLFCHVVLQLRSNEIIEMLNIPLSHSLNDEHHIKFKEAARILTSFFLRLLRRFCPAFAFSYSLKCVAEICEEKKLNKLFHVYFAILKSKSVRNYHTHTHMHSMHTHITCVKLMKEFKCADMPRVMQIKA